jgi:hypothetical protein
MRTARSAIQFARQVAAALGDGWNADLTGCSDWAILNGPDGIELDVHASMADKTVAVNTRPDGSLVWPTRGDFHGRLEGKLGDPSSTADRITEEFVPAWRDLREILSVRTERAKDALLTFVDAALPALGPGATVSWGSRPAVATLVWPGGRVHLFANGDGDVIAPEISIQQVGADAILTLLGAVRP